MESTRFRYPLSIVVFVTALFAAGQWVLLAAPLGGDLISPELLAWLLSDGGLLRMFLLLQLGIFLVFSALRVEVDERGLRACIGPLSLGRLPWERIARVRPLPLPGGPLVIIHATRGVGTELLRVTRPQAFAETVRRHAPEGEAREALLAAARRWEARSDGPLLAAGLTLGILSLAPFLSVHRLVADLLDEEQREFQRLVAARLDRPPLTVNTRLETGRALRVAADTSWAVAGGVLFDVRSGRELARLSPELAPGGRLLLGNAVYDAPRGIWIPLELPWIDPSPGQGASRFSPDGERVIRAGWFGITLSDARTGALVARLHHVAAWRRVLGSLTQRGFSGWTVPAGGAPIGQAWLSPDGRLAAGLARGEAEELVVWEVGTGEILRRLPTGHVTSVGFPADGSTILTHRQRRSWEPSDSLPSATVLWDMASGERVRTAVEGAWQTEVSLDGRWIASLRPSGDADDSVALVVRDAANGVEAWRMAAPRLTLDFAFSGDGRLLLTQEGEAIVTLRDPATGAPVERRAVESVRPQLRAVPPAGNAIVTRHGVWRLDRGTFERPLARPGDLGYDIDYSDDGAVALIGRLASDSSAELTVWDNRELRPLTRFALELGRNGGPTAAALAERGMDNVAALELAARAPGGPWRVELGTDSTPYHWRLHGPDGAHEFYGSRGSTDSVAGYGVEVTPDGALALRSGDDVVARLVTFRDGTWAVVDSSGRFDGSNGGDVAGAHFVVGLEPVSLHQLRERYYEPGLLAKLTGFNDEPLRDVSPFRDVSLYPIVRVVQAPTAADPRLRARLENRGGGIGRVAVYLNGKEISADARPAAADPAADSLLIELDLAGHPLLDPGGENRVEVAAYNAEGYMSGRSARGFGAQQGREPDVTGPPPTLWAVVVGVSDYRGEAIDLRYAGKDAVDFARALEVAGEGLFPGRVRVRLLSTDGAHERPSRAAILGALGEVRAGAAAHDVVVVYLAGHGVTEGAAGGEYFYLTADAANADLRDPQVRAQVAFSSEQVADELRTVPARKQLLILDTCAAGRAVENFTLARDVPASQVRAIHRMKERAGLWVLAGAAADAVSYEASRFAQGLLTHALLLGMRGAALRDGELVDVAGWFAFAADEVPRLASDIGGIQQPELAAPRGAGSFDVGRVAAADRARIPLESPRPVLVRAVFQDERRFRDALGLSRRVDEGLREAAYGARGAGGAIVFVDAAEFPDAYSLAGRYAVSGGRVAVDVKLFHGEAEVGAFRVAGTVEDPDGLARAIVGRATALSAARPPAPAASAAPRAS